MQQGGGGGGASGTDYNDNVKVRFGTGNDLEIYHDGFHSNIVNNTGDLYIQGSGDDIIMRAADDIFIQVQNGEDGIKVHGNGSVELYHNSVKKLETKSDGIDVIGEVQCDSLDVDGTADISGRLTVDSITLRDNNSSSPLLVVRADDQGPWAFVVGNDTYSTTQSSGLAYYQDNAGNCYQRINGSGAYENFYLQQSNGSTLNTAIHINTDRAVILKYQNSSKLLTKSNGVDIVGELECDGIVVDGAVDIDINSSSEVTSIDSFVLNGGNNKVAIKCHANQGGDPYIFFDAGGTNFVVGEQYNGGSSNKLRLGSGNNMGSVQGMEITASGHCNPDTNNARDLGSSSNRWRNVYTNDLNLSNEGSGNDVDGTWGNYTIQEGEDDLFLINRRNGKKYKFNLTEVS